MKKFVLTQAVAFAGAIVMTLAAVMGTFASAGEGRRAAMVAQARSQATAVALAQRATADEAAVVRR